MLRAIVFASKVAVAGIVLGLCAAVIMHWNERQHGAQMSDYRFEWFTALGAPGAGVASFFESVDRRLGETSALGIFSIAISNGLVYLIAALLARLIWMACQSRMTRTGAWKT